MNELMEFSRMSKYVGERFDLTQAGGGNTSVKIDNDIMLIKASGYYLSEVEENNGYSKVETKKVVEVLVNKKVLSIKNKDQREKEAASYLKNSVLDNMPRPSIETFLHAMLGKYVLHVHPIVVSAITCQESWQDVLSTLFDEAMYVRYKTPGLELAIELKQQLQVYIKEFKYPPKVIFLQNHGIIVNSDTVEEAISVLEKVLIKIESYLKLDLSSYKLTNIISNIFNSIALNNNITYLSEDQQLKKLLEKKKDSFFTMPFCPDKLVYCGIGAIELMDLEDKATIKAYLNKYQELPKVIIYKSQIFFSAQNIKKAKEAEEVFKFHVMTLSMSNSKVNCLSDPEIAYLSGWEAEKYRSKL